MKIIISLIKTIAIWLILLAFEEWRFPGPSNYLVQIPACIWFFMNAYVGVDPHDYKEVHRRTGSLVAKLDPGFYFYPFLWFWGIVYYSPKIKYTNTKRSNFDQSKAILKREIGFWEGVSREFIIPFIMRNGLWAIFVSIIFGSTLGFYSVKYKNKIVYKIENSFDPFLYIFSKNKTEEKDKTNFSGIKSDKENPQIRSGNNTNNSSSVSDQSPEQNNGITWDYTKIPGYYKHKDIAKFVKLQKGENKVRIRGYFYSDIIDGVVYPQIYVDGYKDLNPLELFYISVDSLIYKNKMLFKKPEEKSKIESYYRAIEKNNFNSDCYRDIVIGVKDEFKNKISWLIIDYSSSYSNFSMEILYDK
ncbi:MAG: hypothetical protein WCO35_01395 [Candidatus Nomurabacteria bacterium]